MHTNHDQISVPSKVSPVYHWLYPNHVFASPFSQIFQYQNGTKKRLKNEPQQNRLKRRLMRKAAICTGGGGRQQNGAWGHPLFSFLIQLNHPTRLVTPRGRRIFINSFIILIKLYNHVLNKLVLLSA